MFLICNHSKLKYYSELCIRGGGGRELITFWCWGSAELERFCKGSAVPMRVGAVALDERQFDSMTLGASEASRNTCLLLHLRAQMLSSSHVTRTSLVLRMRYGTLRDWLWWCGQKDVRTEEKALLVIYFKPVRIESKDIKTCVDICAVSKRPYVFARPKDSTRRQ